jgi:hypothetical protein
MVHPPRLTEEMQKWIEARKRFHLSHAQVQMARELGMNPRKLGSLANHKQEPWKAPLPIFIEQVYRKRFGKSEPDRVLSIEDRAQEITGKKAERRELRASRKILEYKKEDEPSDNRKRPVKRLSWSLNRTLNDGGRSSMEDRKSMPYLRSKMIDFSFRDSRSSILHPRFLTSVQDEPGCNPLGSLKSRFESLVVVHFQSAMRFKIEKDSSRSLS